MSNFLRILFAIITLTLFACSGSGEKVKRSQLIPSKEVVSILTDLYLADGLLILSPVRALYSKKDSSTSYMEIIEKHGYTKELMDKTMKYYFSKDPKKLEKIYDDVLARLSEMQSRLVIKTPTVVPGISYDLWTTQNNYSVPEAGVNNPIFFSIPVKDTGLYELSMVTAVYPDDQSLNPRINVFFWHADNSETGVRDYWTSVNLPKDGERHNYILSKRLTDTTFTHFNGWLLYSDSKTGRWEKHAIIEAISLRKVTKK
jgi:hypothetical protein